MPSQRSKSKARKKTARTPAKKQTQASKSSKSVATRARTATKVPLPQLLVQPNVAQSQFSGVLFVANGQSSLNGTLLLLDGVAGFAAAVAAAAQALQNQGFQSGQTITVTGRSAVVHLDEHPIQVIVMSGATAG